MRRCGAPQPQTVWSRQVLCGFDVKHARRVAFLREPFARAISAFADSEANRYIRIKAIEASNETKHLNYSNQVSCVSFKDCSWHQWVQALYDRRHLLSASVANQRSLWSGVEHFVPQKTLLASPGEANVTCVFLLEDEHHQECFWSELLQAEDQPAKANDATTLAGEYATEQLLHAIAATVADKDSPEHRMLAEIYADDIEMYNRYRSVGLDPRCGCSAALQAAATRLERSVAHVPSAEQVVFNVMRWP